MINEVNLVNIQIHKERMLWKYTISGEKRRIKGSLHGALVLLYFVIVGLTRINVCFFSFL